MRPPAADTTASMRFEGGPPFTADLKISEDSEGVEDIHMVELLCCGVLLFLLLASLLASMSGRKPK